MSARRGRPTLANLLLFAPDSFVPNPFVSRDIRGKLVLLGTGTSVGVPIIGCGCSVCLSTNPRNQRTRCAVVAGLPEGNLLIDTPPDLRAQLVRERLGLIHAVLYTHEHTDHLMGMDDIRIFQFRLNGAVPLYCEEPVERRIRAAFDYAFSDAPATHAGAAPLVEFHRISTEPFALLGATIVPIRLLHGPRFQVLGFRLGNVAYCTDASEIPDESWPLLEGLDVLVLDALRLKPHATHLCLDEAVEIARRLKPRQTYFTHTSHDMEYDETNARLPPGMALAHDGLELPLS